MAEGTGRMNMCIPTGGGAIVHAIFTTDYRQPDGSVAHVPIALMADGRALVWVPDEQTFDVRQLEPHVLKELRHHATQQHRMLMAGAVAASEEFAALGAH